MGATPQLSWIAVLGYSSASTLPAVLISWLGPCVVDHCSKQRAFSTTDFGRKRYGRIMQVAMACVSGFYMFIFIVAELTALSTVFAELTQNYTTKYNLSITVSMGAFTILYTALAGLPASIVTDKFQALIVALLVICLTLATTTNSANHVSRSEFAVASNWTLDGFQAAVTLVLAIASAELFNQGNWQRVWAAESVTALRHGLAIGGFMVFCLMMFFGTMGMIAYANDPEGFDNGEKYAYLAFFYLLEPLDQGWQILTLILVTSLCASSVDTLQNALSSIFSRDLVKIGWHPQWFVRAFMVLINVPAIYLASEGYDVISLFLVADLVCATSVFPVFCGLQTHDHGILKAPTELGAFLGCLSGIVTVLVNGAINNVDGGVFQYFWLPNGGICALCGTATMTSFIVTPLVSLVMTYLFTYLDIVVRGERARRPLITVAFDDDDDDDDEVDDDDQDALEPGKVIDKVQESEEASENDGDENSEKGEEYGKAMDMDESLEA